ncbi:MAG: 5'-nucleotidase C-terminal domain-containing protein [Armatimonadetes bacterium]|nr:5'-nucleotidase C-terminal domain-containing protein [Armatimonadota bacterium]
MFARRVTFSLALFLGLFGQCLAQGFSLTILHTNDMHAHMDATRLNGVMYGGYARQATLVKRIRSKVGNVLLLNGGDTFQGTIYFNAYEGLSDLAFMNYVGYDAMAAGNHEFDRGPSVLAAFIRLMNFPMLAANINISRDEHLRGLIGKSTTIKVGGQTIGIVGAVTPSLHAISSPGEDVKMLDILASTQAEIDRLRADGINKIVMVSHVGYSSEVWLAQQLKGIDVIVGGHSHTLLGSMDGSSEGARPYPTRVTNAEGDTALVVQAYQWGMILGRLNVEFDKEGRVTSWSGGPIPITEDIPEDPVAKSMIAAFTKPVEELKNRIVGETTVTLDRDGQSVKGSVMSELVADSQYEATKSMGVVAAFINSGGVRTALEPGGISYGDAITVQPFNNTLVVIELTGAEIKASLEHGVGNGAGGHGGFLTPSTGTSYTVDHSQPLGQRISRIIIGGEALDLNKSYKVAINNFTVGGGDAHEVLKNAKGQRFDTGLLDIDALVEYIRNHSPLDRGPASRVTIKTSAGAETCGDDLAFQVPISCASGGALRRPA